MKNFVLNLQAVAIVNEYFINNQMQNNFKIVLEIKN